jgi:hypothetical protein
MGAPWVRTGWVSLGWFINILKICQENNFKKIFNKNIPRRLAAVGTSTFDVSIAQLV